MHKLQKRKRNYNYNRTSVLLSRGSSRGEQDRCQRANGHIQGEGSSQYQNQWSHHISSRGQYWRGCDHHSYRDQHGDLVGAHEVVLQINGAKVEAKQVTFDGGESQEVIFTVAKGGADAYTVNIDGVSGSFVVRKEVPAVAEDK